MGITLYGEELNRQIGAKNDTNMDCNRIHHRTLHHDVVFDYFSGTGTTCVAAKKLGRGYLGIEIDEESYRTSVERLKTT